MKTPFNSSDDSELILIPVIVIAVLYSICIALHHMTWRTATNDHSFESNAVISN